MRTLFLLWLTGTVVAAASPIETIRAVGKEGEGNAAAAAALEELSAADASQLVTILQGMRGANPLAANWLRAAVDVIAARSGNDLPVADLGEFLLDRSQNQRARRLSFELIAKVDPALAESLVPGMLSDPSPELRRDAVARLMGQADALTKSENEPGATLLYRQALSAALDVEQVKEIAKQLRGLGCEVDLPKHFGFLTHWHVIAPFDNTGREGFEKVYPPEQGVDLSESYPGKAGPASWQPLATGDKFGMVDLNKPFGMLKEVVGYAYATYESETARTVELRLGCKNAWKVWVNGEFVFGRDEYHRGMRIDQYRIPVQLEAGKNTILIKLCQNEQKEEWTVQWQFQMRVSDSSGTAVLAKGRLPTPKAESGRRPPRRPKKNADAQAE